MKKSSERVRVECYVIEGLLGPIGSAARVVFDGEIVAMDLNRSMAGIFAKGVRAGLIGDNRCPYVDKRKHDGRLTFSRGFIRAWEDGFEVGRKAAARR